jgi:hypothetical protein
LRPGKNHRTVVGLRSRRPRSTRRSARLRDRPAHLARWRRHCRGAHRARLRRHPSAHHWVQRRLHRQGRPRLSRRRSRRLSGRRGSRRWRARWASSGANHVPAAAGAIPYWPRAIWGSHSQFLEARGAVPPCSRSRETGASCPRGTCLAMQSGAQPLGQVGCWVVGVKQSTTSPTGPGMLQQI